MAAKNPKIPSESCVISFRLVLICRDICWLPTHESADEARCRGPAQGLRLQLRLFKVIFKVIVAFSVTAMPMVVGEVEEVDPEWDVPWSGLMNFCWIRSLTDSQVCQNWQALLFVQTKTDFQVPQLPCNECGDERITCLDGIFHYVFFCNRRRRSLGTLNILPSCVWLSLHDQTCYNEWV